MHLSLRRHFWLAHLVFTFFAAWFVSRTVNGFVEASLLAPPTSEAPLPMPVRSTVPPRLDLEATARLLGLSTPQGDLPPGAEAVDLSAGPTRSALGLRLLGTLVSEARPEWSIASLQDVATQKTNTFMADDVLPGGARVLRIERQRVIILNGTRLEFIDGSGAGTTPVHSRLEGNTYEFARTEVDKALANLSDIATQARFVPAFKGGAMQGFKVFSIRPDSIYSRLGVQNGDTIRRINGFELDSPERLLELYAKVKTSARVELELERNGAALRMAYVLK